MACIATVSMAMALILFVGINSFIIGCVLMVFFGFATVVMDISNQTIIQSTIRSRFRGRTMSIYGMVAQGAPAVGALAMGYMAETTGLRWPVFAGACIAFLAGALALVFRGRFAGPQPRQTE